MSAFLGLDVAKKSFAAHLLGRSRGRTFPNSPAGYQELLHWLGSVSPDQLRACMEATSTYHLGLADALYQAGLCVHVANPWTVKQYGKSILQRGKTDPADAKLIAQFCEAHPRLRPWRPLAPELADLAMLVRHDKALREQLVALRNRLHQAALPAIQASLQRQQEALKKEIVAAQQAIAEHIQAHPNLAKNHQLLLSIPSIGPVSAPRILAELGDWERFDNVRQVAAYAGLTPAAHESGTSVRGPSRLSRMGSQNLRNALYMPGMVLLRMRRLGGAFIERMLAQGRHKKTIIAALMRKLLHVIYGVLKSGQPYAPDYKPSSAPQATAQGPEASDQRPEGDTSAPDRRPDHTRTSPCATLPSRGETEAGSAGEQPTKGYPRGANRSKPEPKHKSSARAHPPSGRLPIPRKTQESALTT